MSFPFRDRSRLSDRYRGKTADELLNELKSEIDNDRKMFFETPFPRSGFPFDDGTSRGRQDIRSHLEDLAHRHPEFADRLRCPPWGGEVGPSQTSWSRTGQGSTGDSASSFQQPCEQEQVDEPGPLRGRARQNNLPQHGLRNTVDLGQQQHEVEQEKGSRGQRSMSAPPDNRTSDQPQRFVSRIDINPLNPGMSSSGDGKPPVAPKQQSPQKPVNKPQQGTSNVRHIPIFVEGRDEPVISKNMEAPEKIFTERTIPTQTAFASERIPPSHTPFVERVIPTQTAFPSERVGRPQSPFMERGIPTQTTPPQPSFGFSRPSHFTSQHQFQPRQSSPPPQGTSFAKKQQQPHEQPEEQQQPKTQPQPSKTPHKAPERSDPLSRVQAIEKDVEELSKKVDSYTGNSRKDKDYIYLDEMLTRNLLKLDVIETEGKENVRQARKSVIRNIQRCISTLESRVPIPEESMDMVEDPLPEQGEIRESDQPVCATDVEEEVQNSELANSEVPVQSSSLQGEITNTEEIAEQTSQPNEPMNVEVAEGKEEEVAKQQSSDAAEVDQMESIQPAQVTEEQEQVQAPCLEMTETNLEQQAESSGDQLVEGESKPAEPVGGSVVEVTGDSTSELSMEVDSADVQPQGQDGGVDSVPSANTELGGGDHPPSKTKKGVRKTPGKSKKSASQSSS